MTTESVAPADEPVVVAMRSEDLPFAYNDYDLLLITQMDWEGCPNVGDD